MTVHGLIKLLQSIPNQNAQVVIVNEFFDIEYDLDCIYNERDRAVIDIRTKEVDNE